MTSFKDDKFSEEQWDGGVGGIGGVSVSSHDRVIDLFVPTLPVRTVFHTRWSFQVVVWLPSDVAVPQYYFEEEHVVIS